MVQVRPSALETPEAARPLALSHRDVAIRGDGLRAPYRGAELQPGRAQLVEGLVRHAEWGGGVKGTVSVQQPIAFLSNRYLAIMFLSKCFPGV